MSFILPPKRRLSIIKLFIKIAELNLKKKLLANRILMWYPKAFWGSGLMELFICHKDKELSPRMLKLIRIYTSVLVSCPFCMQLNTNGFEKYNISPELKALLFNKNIKEGDGLTEHNERIMLRYVEAICKTPVSFDQDVVQELKDNFSERAIVIIASTTAQVNFWARLIQAFGVNNDNCRI